MKYSDVKWYLKYGQDVAKLFDTIQPMGEIIDQYWPGSANWAYYRMIVSFNGKIYDVLTRFGTVVGGRELSLYDNTNKAGL
jgi:hypothetical protein